MCPVTMNPWHCRTTDQEPRRIFIGIGARRNPRSVTHNAMRPYVFIRGKQAFITAAPDILKIAIEPSARLPLAVTESLRRALGL